MEIVSCSSGRGENVKRDAQVLINFVSCNRRLPNTASKVGSPDDSTKRADYYVKFECSFSAVLSALEPLGGKLQNKLYFSRGIFAYETVNRTFELYSTIPGN